MHAKRIALTDSFRGAPAAAGLARPHAGRLLRMLPQVPVLPKTTLTPVDHSDSPFHELDLEELWKGIGKTRVRQHVNPLRREYQVPAGPLDWSRAFADPTLPLVLDLGCGPGRFLMLLHKRRAEQHAEDGAQQPTCNYLGIEIREKLVERANEWVQRLNFQDHVHYAYSNATISLASMMANYPGKITSVYIQFPDPHFKKRHRKRRIFQPDLVKAICELIPPGGQLFLQSDVEMVSSAMRNIFEMYAFHHFELAPQHSGLEEDVFYSAQSDTCSPERNAGMEAAGMTGAASDDEGGEAEEAVGPGESAEDYDSMKSQWAAAGWLRHNPIGIPTEREHYVLQQGLPVYRVLLVRTQLK